MTALIVAALIAVSGTPFIADATAEFEFTVKRPENQVRDRLQDIQTLRRRMPGVVAIEERGNDRWLYRTERKMPLQDPVRTDFIITRSIAGAVVFRTPEADAPNWMSFRFETLETGVAETLVRVRARVRLVRDDGAAIHVFAPILGEAFISNRMEEDLESMLATFADRVQLEFDSATTAHKEAGEK